MPKSPFPKYDPKRANVVYKRNFHVTILLFFISILYLCAAIGCIIKLALPSYSMGNLFKSLEANPETWAIWVNLWLFILTIPTFLIMALKGDFMFGMLAPLKCLPLMLSALVEIVVIGVQGMKWNVDWMEGILLVAIPITTYILCVVMGRTQVGREFFLPFREEKKKLDLEWESNAKPKPEIHIRGPTPPATKSEAK
jgi:hypothetical protein